MNGNRGRLHLLLLLLAAAIVLSFYYDRSGTSAPPKPGRTGILPVFQSHVSGQVAPIPDIHQLPPAQDESNTTTPHRNPFRYADVPPAPKYVPPPPPPPPPEIKPESRFLGTLDEGHLHALFGFKGDVLPLKEGDTLEGKYLVKQVDTDSVLLEDTAHGNTTIFTLAKK